MGGIIRGMCFAMGLHLGPTTVADATVFRAVGDPGNPSASLACLWADHARRRRLQLDDATMSVVAHRSWPCGARVMMANPRTGKIAMAVVGDRGPMHADLDLSAEAARLLSHNGREKVIAVLLDSRSPAEAEVSPGRTVPVHAAPPILGAGGTPLERAVEIVRLVRISLQAL